MLLVRCTAASQRTKNNIENAFHLQYVSCALSPGPPEELLVELGLSPEPALRPQHVETQKEQAMERDSQEQRRYSQSWPPGFLTGSLVFDAEARARRRDGLTMACLAVCAYCLGFTVTDRACEMGEKAAAAQRGEAEAVASQRKRAVEPTGARAEVPVPEPTAPEPAPAPVVTSTKTSPVVQKRKKRAPVESRSERVPAEISAAADEPTPMVSVEELNQALALADASQRIFASVDENTSTKPIAVVPPPAAAMERIDAIPATVKVVAIEGLSVDGALPSKVVNRGVQRLLPQYDRCREYSDIATQRLKLSTTIDEAGRGRHVTVEGLSKPGLRRCLEQATAHLVVPAPDTGTARAHWVVRFAAR